MLSFRRDQVRSLWDKVEKEFDLCSECLVSAGEAAASNMPILRAKYSYCYSVYEWCVAQLVDKIEQGTSQSIPTANAAPQAYISSGCRLPPCDTEVFAGDYLRWPTFRDLFTAIYINNPRLTPVEKLFHLNAKTSGDAHAISIPQEFGAALKVMQSTVQGCLTALELSGINTENWDCLLVYLCSSKLPKITLSLWEQSLHKKADIPTWGELNTFLTERHRTLEAIDD
ncbi:gag-pol polyprotein precursor, partial [Lasius niger]